MKSLKRLLATSPSILYPGHGPVVKDAVTHIQQYIDHRQMRETQVRTRSITHGHIDIAPPPTHTPFLRF